MRKILIICGAVLVLFLAIRWIFTPSASENWKASASARGIINMDAVRTAFIQSKTIPDFEKRVNEINEGENLAVFSMKKASDGFELTAWADLNANGRVDSDAGDDALFKITTGSSCADIVGMGINKFYKSQICPYPVKNHTSNIGNRNDYGYMGYRPRSFYGYHRYGSYPYRTPYQDTMSLKSHRNTYRNSDQYISQLSSNDNYVSGTHQRQNSGQTPGLSSTREAYIRRKSKNTSFIKSLNSPSSTSSSSLRSRLASTGRVKSPSSSSFSSRFSGSFKGISGFSV